MVGCSGTAPPLRPVAAAAASGGSAVRLWQDASIFGLVARMITSAHHQVLVEVYELGRADIVQDLGAATGRGVDVRVITDPSVNPSRLSAARLDALRVPERAYPIDDARHQIDHVKLLIADGEAAVGGMNWGNHSSRNHDYVLETRIPSEVERLERIFEQDWSLAGGRPAPLRAMVGDVAQTAPGQEIRDMIEAALTRAKRRVLVEMYTLTDPTVVAELVAAHRRGVDVRVVLDPNQVYNRHASTVLGEGGVGVRWYPVPRGVLLHAKVGLFDRVLVLGSANWTLSGLGANHELDIETEDGAAVAAYVARFDSDWSRSSA
jgi:phosphatidylserine/phosphatidylglycerophosphate/cardiolipin synthase-like enzyme